MAQAPAVAPSGPRAPDQTATGAGQAGVPAPGMAAPAPAPSPGMLTELKVSGHVMNLDSGLYCIVHKPAAGGSVPAGGPGLPGIRVSIGPDASGRPGEAVEVVSFRPDGWLAFGGDAALVRVHEGPAPVLVTIYQSPAAPERTAPNIQVMKLLEGGAPARAAPARPAPAPARPPDPVPEPTPPAAPRGPAVMEMIAHIQERGDVGAMLGEWLGERGSKRWIEGFGLSPTHEIAPRDIEYQGVLGQGWLSPWVEGGQFCGSRAMALPLLGLRVRLRGEAAAAYDVSYAASFVDGTEVGPVSNGEACEADSLAAMEAFHVTLRRRDPAEPARPGRAKPAPVPVEPARPKPASRKR